jgi:hypothetical protein
MSYLYADDDDGDITNGTPHMQAIFAAHDRQEIACDKPKVKDSGCLDSPGEAPVVSVVAGSMQVTVKWTAVDSATNYQIFRAEGVNKCSQGKVLLATITSDVLNYTDSGLMNGREYYYLVIPKGSDDSCFGPASICTSATPIEEPDYQIRCQSDVLVLGLVSEPKAAVHSCTIFPLGGFNTNVTLSFDAPDGFNCSATSPISISSGNYTNFQVTINTTSLVEARQHQINVIALSEDIVRYAKISVLVVDKKSSNGYHLAVYNPNLGAPMCFVESKQCSSGKLLRGRGDVGPEKHAPNTLDGCMDGSLGTFNEDEVLNQITIRSGRLKDKVASKWIREKEFVTITASVWSYSPEDSADFWITTEPSNPVWKYIGSVNSKMRDRKEQLKVETKLSRGTIQAVRVSFHYFANETITPCLERPYDDVDDLGKL